MLDAISSNICSKSLLSSFFAIANNFCKCVNENLISFVSLVFCSDEIDLRCRDWPTKEDPNLKKKYCVSFTESLI